MNSRITINQNKPLRQDSCKAWLVERGITLTQLAQAIGVSPMMVSHIITGRKTHMHEIEFHKDADEEIKSAAAYYKLDS